MSQDRMQSKMGYDPKEKYAQQRGREVGEGSAGGGGERAAMPSSGGPGNHLLVPLQGVPLLVPACVCLQADSQMPTCSARRVISKGLTVVRKGSERRGQPLLHCVTCPCVFPANNDRTVCKEIRHNSTGCLRMKDQCEKCQEILEVGESGSPGLMCLQVPSTSLGLP